MLTPLERHVTRPPELRHERGSEERCFGRCRYFASPGCYDPSRGFSPGERTQAHCKSDEYYRIQIGDPVGGMSALPKRRGLQTLQTRQGFRPE